MDVLKKMKDFENKYKSKITYTSSLLLSIGIHAAIITIFLISMMIEYKKERTPQLKNEQKVKINLRSEQPKKNIKKEKKVFVRNQNYKFEEADQNITEESISSLNEKTEYPNEGIEIAYGPEFFMLSKEEQDYIVSQWKRNNRVNELISAFEKERDLNTSELKMTDTNIISFYLYPDGNISDIELLNKREDVVFDKIVKKTIEKSAKYYKRPERKTLIKIHVGMGLKDE